MGDIVWFARFTSSGVPGTLELEVDFFYKAFEEALELYKIENKQD